MQFHVQVDMLAKLAYPWALSGWQTQEMHENLSELKTIRSHA